MDYVQFYKDCDSVLHHLMTIENHISIKELREISPNYYKYIIQEFNDKNIADVDNILGDLTIHNDKEKALYHFNTRYYERKTDEALANQKRDNLLERSTISAEESAKWAEKSSDAADKSASIAARSNKIAVVAIVISIIVAILQFVTSCTPTIQLFFKLI